VCVPVYCVCVLTCQLSTSDPINRSHTHTHTHTDRQRERERTTPPAPTHTCTRQEHHPKPPNEPLPRSLQVIRSREYFEVLLERCGLSHICPSRTADLGTVELYPVGLYALR